MFDTVLVHESLIREATKDTDILFESYEGYCDFQTKDLDNTLSTFYIEEDGGFYSLRLHRKYVPPPEKVEKGKFHFGDWVETAPPEKILDTRTTYIQFYDFYNTEQERIFVTFRAHVKCGKLVDPITVVSLERTDLKKEYANTKIFNEKWEKIRKDKRWILGSLIRDVRRKIYKIFNPITKFLDKIESNLLDSARHEQFPPPKNNLE